MEKLLVNMINNSRYMACITVLDYAIFLSKCLKEIVFEPSSNGDRYVLVDLALKVGIGKDRFAEFKVNETGKILTCDYKYVIVEPMLENIANNYLKQNKEIVLHSMLTDSQKKKILYK